MKKIPLTIILFLALVLRLYRVNFPLLDWHSWRQADTASVSRNFVKFGVDLLHPRFDDLSNIASGLDNPEGHRFVEFPIYNWLNALLAGNFPRVEMVVWGRLLSIIFSLGSLYFLYLIVKRFSGEKAALLTAFFYAVLPFNVYYGRTVLPEPMMVFSGLGMIWFFSQYLEEKTIEESKIHHLLLLALALTMASVSFLLKPYAMVLLVPVAYLAWRKWQSDWRRYFPLGVGIILSVLPFLLWRRWMSQYPEGIPVYDWLFNEGGIRFKGAWFYWLFAERLGKLILGYWGLIFFGLGLMTKTEKKESWFFYSWLLAILIYLAVIAGGNVKHDYYQYMTIPIVCVFLAKGAAYFLSPPRGLSKLFTFSFSLLAFFTFGYLKKYHELSKKVSDTSVSRRAWPPQAGH